jgi:hypothetical protein
MELSKLIRFQAIVRGFLARRNVELIQPPEGKYFSRAESLETAKGVYKRNRPFETRSHNYETGASYKGGWQGGLRHGKGAMIWADQGRYEGQWQFNQACG